MTLGPSMEVVQHPNTYNFRLYTLAPSALHPALKCGQCKTSLYHLSNLLNPLPRQPTAGPKVPARC
jgi:hypothetical protein